MNKEPMTEERKNLWKKIFADSEKKRRRILPIRRNQLSLWLGRLVIAYNNLENALAVVLMTELVELIGKDGRRAREAGLGDMIMASISFKQKLDFLIALLLKRFSDNPEHLKHIDQFVRLIYAADEYRNKMVHSVWEESYTDYSRVKAKIKGQKGLKVERHDADTKQIREATEVIEFLEVIGGFYLTNPIYAKKYKFDYELLGQRLRPNPKVKTYPNIFTVPDK